MGVNSKCPQTSSYVCLLSSEKVVGCIWVLIVLSFACPMLAKLGQSCHSHTWSERLDLRHFLSGFSI